VDKSVGKPDCLHDTEIAIFCKAPAQGPAAQRIDNPRNYLYTNFIKLECRQGGLMAADKNLVREINGNLRHLIQLLQTRSKKIRKETGITGPQLLAMKTLSESPGISISEIARRIYLHPATVVGIVDRLEGRGFVARKRSKEDRRQVNVRLTAKGSAALRKAPAAAQGSGPGGLETLPEKKLKSLSFNLAQLVRILELSAKGPVTKRRRGRPRKEESLPRKRQGRKTS
jgi:MarR family transcriptional regulator, organic hydroperoxide resistance regulator